MDKETGLPDGYRLHQHRHRNRLIEEFMLLANMAVAHKIYKAFPELAVLRRHPPPKGAMLEGVVEQLATLGIHLDGSSSASLARSLDTLRAAEGLGPEELASRLAAVTSLVSKPMELARYFCLCSPGISVFTRWVFLYLFSRYSCIC
jgi:DIS3-like exonuclease 2